MKMQQPVVPDTGMGESLYAILGVDEDADRGDIQAAFRESAKHQHPDVNDDPDATRQFRRLTVARDTLLDAKERARYDDLGHDAYLCQHSQAGLFDVTPDEDARPSAEPQTARTTTDDTVTDGFGTHDRWWRDREGPQPEQRTSTNGTGRENSTTATWARSTDSTVDQTTTDRSRVVTFVRDAGGWLLVHLFLIGSAAATGWFVYTSVPPGMAGGAMFLLFGLVAVTVAVAVFHLVSIVYT